MRAKVINAKPLDNTTAFRDMSAGEFLVSDTGNVGVKTKSGGILWVVASSINAYVGTETLPHDISHGKRYRQPVSVVVTV